MEWLDRSRLTALPRRVPSPPISKEHRVWLPTSGAGGVGTLEFSEFSGSNTFFFLNPKGEEDALWVLSPNLRGACPDIRLRLWTFADVHVRTNNYWYCTLIEVHGGNDHNNNTGWASRFRLGRRRQSCVIQVDVAGWGVGRRERRHETSVERVRTKRRAARTLFKIRNREPCKIGANVARPVQHTRSSWRWIGAELFRR